MLNLKQGDCLKLMDNVPDKSIDLILADLPYGITHAHWDNIIPLDRLWMQYRRIIKDHGAIALFGSEPFTSNLIMSNLKMFRYNWVWHKTLPTGFLNSHQMPLRACENISIFYKHLPTYHPQMRKGKPHKGKITRKSSHNDGVFYKKSFHRIRYKNKGVKYPVNIIKFANKNQHRLHPTQKPIPLLKYLIKTYTDENDLVLDNVMGSGSTGVAARLLKRDFIGMEKNPKYFDIAKKRLNQLENKEVLV